LNHGARERAREREAPPALFGWLCNRRGAGAEPVASTQNLAQLSAWRGAAAQFYKRETLFRAAVRKKAIFLKRKASRCVSLDRAVMDGLFLSVRGERESCYYNYTTTTTVVGGVADIIMLCIPPPSAPPTRVLCASRTNTHTRVVEPACCTSFGAIPLREKRGRRRLQPPPPRPAR
jgi:hypothetical protein